MKTYRLVTVAALAVAAATSLVLIGSAAGKSPKQSATPVFKLSLKPSQEVPRIQGLRASGTGSLTFDLVRNTSGQITSGEAIFYVNYTFPGSVEINGLHVHKAARGVIGPVVINSGLTTFTDADGQGNITTVVASVDPALLQAILDKPRDYYVNLHTAVNTGGAMRDQLRSARKH
jgi:hypothetical protein